MAHDVGEYGENELPWMPISQDTYWGKNYPEQGQNWRPGDKIRELLD
jgi:hypothetical protein